MAVYLSLTTPWPHFLSWPSSFPSCCLSLRCVWCTGMWVHDVCFTMCDSRCAFHDVCDGVSQPKCLMVCSMVKTQDFDIWSLVTRHTCNAAFATTLPTTLRLSHPASRHSTRALNQSGVPLNECVLMCNEQHVASFFAPRLSFTSLYLPPSLA